MVEISQEELETDIKDFEEWFKKEEMPPEKHNGRTPVGVARVKFQRAINFIIAEAKKGYPRTSIYKYLKDRGKIDFVYVTFCDHLKKNNLQKYFSDYKPKPAAELLAANNSSVTVQDTKTPSTSQKMPFPEQKKTETIENPNLKGTTNGLVHNPDPTPTIEKYFGKTTDQKSEGKSKGKSNFTVLDPFDF